MEIIRDTFAVFGLFLTLYAVVSLFGKSCEKKSDFDSQLSNIGAASILFAVTFCIIASIYYFRGGLY